MFPAIQASPLRALSLAGLILAALFSATSTGPAIHSRSTSPSQEKRILVQNIGKLPLAFEVNMGQAQKGVKFLSRGSHCGLFLTGDEAALILYSTALGKARPEFQREPGVLPQPEVFDILRMRLAGATRKAHPVGEEQLPGTVNYFVGSDPTKWRSNIPTYAKVRYAAIYPGIDLVYHGNPAAGDQLEFDFSVSPGASARFIRLRFGGMESLHLAPDGDLLVTTANGMLAFHKPAVYQMAGGQRRSVAGEFSLLGKRTVAFRLGSYDHTKVLLIDPVLAYSTFVGGSGNDISKAIAVDAAGNVYITGQAASTDFPVTSAAFQTTNRAAANQQTNAFVAKLNPTGTALLYATYLGGSGTVNGGDAANALALDASGNLYVTGQTYSTDFPVTPGAYQSTNKAAANAASNVFVTKLNPTGTTLAYSTFLGGSGRSYSGDTGTAIAVDQTGNVYVAGGSYSADFPVTQGAFQTTNHGTASGYVNAFITKLNSTATALAYSTYLGGSGGNEIGIAGDIAEAMALDSTGDAYVSGQAGSSDFPVTSGIFQSTNKATANQSTNAFISKLNPTGTGLVYSTYLGGSGQANGDAANAMAIDAAGHIYVAGQAGSTDFPVTSGAFQTTNHAEHNGPNAFVTELNPAGTALVYSTYLGGSGNQVNLTPTLLVGGGDRAYGLVVDTSGDAYVAGATASSDFPVSKDAYQTTNNDQSPCAGGCVGGYNAFITELNAAGSALIYSTYLGGNGINPNQAIGLTIFGEGDQANALALDNSGGVYLTGQAVSYNFPVISGDFQTTNPSAVGTFPGAGSPFVAKFNSAGSSNPSAPTVTVTPASSSITSALPLTVTVSVSGSSGNPVPTGTVTLASGNYSSAPTTLNAGSATIDIPGGLLVPDEAVACGYPSSPDILSANYVPDAASSSTYKFSSGMGSVDVVAPCLSVTPSVTTISLAQAQSQPFSLTIAAVGATGNPMPTGTVTLTTGTYTSAPATLSAGGATITIPAGTLIAGENLLTLNYSGDKNYAPYPHASGAIVNVTAGPGTPSFTITGTPVTLSPGATSANTSTITVTSTADFKGVVSLAAAVTSAPTGAQYPPTFSFSPSSQVTVGVNPGTAALIIVTTAPGSCTEASHTPFGGVPHAGEAAPALFQLFRTNQARRDQLFLRFVRVGTALACILLLGIPASRRGRPATLGMLFLLIVAGGLLACGGGRGNRSTCSGTTQGTYAITLTGTSGTTTATGTVTLTVE